VVQGKRLLRKVGRLLLGSGPRVKRLRHQLEEKKQIYAADLAKYRNQYKAHLSTLRDDYNANLAALRLENATLRKELAKVPSFTHGSFTPGVPGWEERWQDRPGKRVLLYALKDYSGSFMKWAAAINQHTEYAARLVVLQAHQYGYEVDLVLRHPHFGHSELRELMAEADLIHVKDEIGFFDGSNRLPEDFLTALRKPLAYTFYGGFARKFQDDPAYRSHVLSFDIRVSMTPDLCFPWAMSRFIPHCINTDRFPYCWSDGKRLAHSPSTLERKGTPEFLEAAMGSLFEVDLIQGVNHRECMERKQKANLFFDQAGKEVVKTLGVDTIIGWYGNSALEAAVHGIPTIAHLSEVALDRAEAAGVEGVRERCAIINTRPGVEGIRKSLEGYASLSSPERQQISRATRAWIEEFHSYKAVAMNLAAAYASLIAADDRQRREMMRTNEA
jgi:hypothetical protein